MDNPLAIIIPVIVGLTALICAAVIGVFLYFTVRRQITLRYSITLVELRTAKILFFVLDAVLISLFIAAAVFLIEPTHGMEEFYTHYFGMSAVLLRVVLGELLLIIFAAFSLCAVLTFSRSAIVDRGVHLATRFLNWHHIYDYHIDEANCTVVLSGNPQGPLTLRGTTVPLKFKRNDIEKMRFILAKNKNKFVSRYEVR